MARWSGYALALVCTVAAFFCSWAHYGGIDLGLTRFPGWQVYLAAVVVLHVGTIWEARVLCLAGAAAALVTAAVLMVNHDNVDWFFDGPVPAVFPLLGIGGPLAVAGVLLNVAVLARAGRRTPRGQSATARPR